MSRKDYKKLAEALRQALDSAANPGEINGVEKAVVLVANVLQADNPRFDRHRFYVACGFPQGLTTWARRVVAREQAAKLFLG